MRRVMWRAPWLTLCVPLCLAVAPVAARADVVKWVDENGVTHYTIERSGEDAELRRRLREPAAEPVVEVEPLRPDFGPEGPVGERYAGPGDGRPDLETPIPAEELVPGPTATARSAAPPVEPLREEPPRPGSASAAPAAAPAPQTPAVGARAPADDAVPMLAQNSARIAELQAQIEQDREALRRLISEGKDQGVDLARDPRVREIAERLPRLHDELDELRGQNR